MKPKNSCSSCGNHRMLKIVASVACGSCGRVMSVKSDKHGVNNALKLARALGCVDSAPGKMWVIDQMVRALTDDGYREWVREFEDGPDGPKTHQWDAGALYLDRDPKVRVGP